jgi:hypothetical protein
MPVPALSSSCCPSLNQINKRQVTSSSDGRSVPMELTSAVSPADRFSSGGLPAAQLGKRAWALDGIRFRTLDD